MSAKEEPATVTTTATRAPKTKSSRLFAVVVLLPLLLAWIAKGVTFASGDVWIPLPLIGYLRWDIFLLAFLFVELPIFWACYQHKNRLAGMILIITILLPYIPDSIRPIYCTRPIRMFFHYYEEMLGFPYPPADQIAITTHHATGLSKQDSSRLAEMALAHQDEWVHTTSAMCLGYFQYGPSINFDRKLRRKPGIWSFQYGLTPSEHRLGRESSYRLHFPELRAGVVSVLKKEALPALRDAYAKTVGASSEKILFGDEVFSNLGVPAITIMLGNAAWNSISNIHTDSIYASKFQEKNERTPFCNSTYDVTTFLLPLTAVLGSGLRYWTLVDEMKEVYYEIGNVYTFNATTIHAIRPLPYYEWRRDDIRMTVQAFGVSCDDGRWVIYH